MEINIVAGKCAELNNRFVFNKLKNRDKSKNHIIIAPDRSLFSIEQRLFDELNEDCFFDINVISLSRLSSQYINTNKKVISKQSGVAIVKNLLNKFEDKLLTFKKATSYIGFASSLFETICLYKSCNIKPEDVYVDDSQTFSNLKQKDIKLIYTEYENFFKNEYTDSFNQLKLFADSIDKNTFKDTVFYILEFDDFTSVMYDIIYKMSLSADEIFIGCTYGKNNSNANIYTNKVYFDLIDLFKFNNAEYRIIYSSDFDDAEKNIITNNLLAFTNVENINSTDKILVNKFENIVDEVKYVVADLYSLVLEKGIDFSKINIVVPSIQTYKNYLSQELEKYDIPYYFDESELLNEHILIRNIVTTCNIIIDNFQVSDFTNLIKSPLLHFDDEATCELDNNLKKMGALSYNCLSINCENEEIVDFITKLLEWKITVKDVNTVSEYLAVINEIYEYFCNKSNEYMCKCDDLAKRIFDQVKRKFEKINKDCTSIFADNNIAFNEFLDIYYSYLETTNISLPPITSNTLFIADSSASHISNVEYLYILGCNEGKLPTYKLDNGLITDDEIARLPNAKKINPTISLINKRKLFKLFELCLKYKDRLTLSYLMLDGEGKLYPNNLITSISQLFDISHNEGSSVLQAISRSLYDIDVVSVIFNNLTRKVAVDNFIRYLKNWNVFNDNINYRQILSSIFYANNENIDEKYITNFIGEIVYPDIDGKLLFKNNSTSVSQIETFYNCPYKHFVRYGLQLKEGIRSDIKPNQIGNIIHEVLKETLPYIISGKDACDVFDFAKDKLSNLLKLEEYSHFSNNLKNVFVIKSLYSEVERICTAIINEIKSSNFVPSYYEYRFNNMKLDNSHITVKGAIDRIDKLDNKFIVVDYKTGDNNFDNYNDVYSGKKLQLLLYAKYFADKNKMTPAGVFYLPVSNGYTTDKNDKYKFNGVLLKEDSNIIDIDTNLVQEGYKSKIVNLKKTANGKIYSSNYYKNMCLDKDDFDYLLNYSKLQVEKAVDRIILGEIKPYPISDKTKTSCDFCEYKALCNYQNNNPHTVVKVDTINTLKKLGEEDGGI